MTPTTFERVPAIRHKLRRAESELDLARESRGYWDSALLALRRDRLTLLAFGLLLVTALFCFVLAEPVTTALGINPNDTDPLIAFEGPGPAHPLGVDQVGRDQLARLLYGGRVSLGIGFFAALIIMTLGLALGSIAGYYGKFVDDAIMWFINTLNSIPFILLLLIISLLFKPTATTLTVFIG
ncbi:MAG TPA: ABC transporter permease subunit, partial [Anaerolineae bacterium]|nr:ABC transporter permease subunit [Anaerolineae bacterium]